MRVGGALHSWNPGIASDDAFIDLRHLNRVTVERAKDGTVWATVGGGCRMKHLLRKLRLQTTATVPTLGLITEQSIAGAVSTATHGSGRHSLSHYVQEMRVAAYDPDTGKTRVYTWNADDELRAARCAVGCTGVILSVKFRCVPAYDVEETMVPCATLDGVLAAEAEYPLQQFYLVPHLWTYFVQRRRAVPPGGERRSLAAQLHRAYWFAVVDLGLPAAVRLLAARLGSPRGVRFFYRYVLPKCILKNVTVRDRGTRLLVMEHELFRHVEIELFVPERHVREAAEFTRAVLEVFDGSNSAPPEAVAAGLRRVGLYGELLDRRGAFTHHFPVTFRRVLPDDALIATSSGDEPYYALSFISYGGPAEPFYALGSFLARGMHRLFGARPHWGKWFPLSGEEVAAVYPRLPEFRAICRRVDPHGVFRNEFTDRVLFGTR